MKPATHHLRRRQLIGKCFEYACLGSTLFCFVVLLTLLSVVVYQGIGWFDWNFLTNFGSRKPEDAGVKAALVGSVYLIGLTSVVSVIVGVATALFLEEYTNRSWWVRLIKFNISNLAGIPSIVYGILGLAVFVRALAFERSLIAGALTLSLVILPVIIIASQEAIRAVPSSIRRASYALGATRWQTVRHQILPAALPGIMTGVILALSRAMGEAAPLITVGAVGYVAFVPASLRDSFTALPIQIFNWTSRPQHEFHNVAAAGIIVLLLLLFTLNAIAVFIRHRFTNDLGS